MKTKSKWMLLLVLIGLLPLTGSALMVESMLQNDTYDNDNHGQEDADSGGGLVSGVYNYATEVGDSTGNIGAHFYGVASATDAGDITQTIDVWLDFAVTAEDWEEYSVTFAPELHARLTMDGSQPDDEVIFNDLNAYLRVNGSLISDTLDNSTYARTTDNTSFTHDVQMGTQTLSGYTGNNTFSLHYVGTVVADAHAAFLSSQQTSGAVLWGMDGTLGGTFDNYANASVRDEDGLFVNASVTLDAVPEPAAMSLIAITGCFALLFRRRFA